MNSASLLLTLSRLAERMSLGAISLSQILEKDGYNYSNGLSILHSRVMRAKQSGDLLTLRSLYVEREPLLRVSEELLADLKTLCGELEKSVEFLKNEKEQS
jgi:hypothetical protein